MKIPLLEEDFDSEGVLAPGHAARRKADMPAAVVLCFFPEVIEQIAARGDAEVVATLRAESGDHTVYRVQRNGRPVGVMHPGVGAPMAAAFLEEAIVLGASSAIAVGGAGALVPDLVLGHPIVVTSAVRDEGTSFHYLPASRVIDADPAGLAALGSVLDDAGVEYLTGRTWTTDAIYRETRSRVDRRVAEGCISVEMEASAFMAVAQFRGIRFGQLLYAGDSLAGETWDSRDWRGATSIREALFWLAVDAALALAESGSGSGSGTA